MSVLSISVPFLNLFFYYFFIFFLSSLCALLSVASGESEFFPGLSRNASRNTERDWDNGSTASSITSMAEYTGQYKSPPLAYQAITRPYNGPIKPLRCSLSPHVSVYVNV